MTSLTRIFPYKVVNNVIMLHVQQSNGGCAAFGYMPD